MIRRRASRPIQVGDVRVGGAVPIVVQSMTKTDTRDVPATVNQIQKLTECGCEIVRIAIPDMEAAEAIAEIKRSVSIPIIADIHFDYRLALAALERGADQVRLNPGNISEPNKVAVVTRAAKEREVPVRIGVNAGSLPRDKQGSQESLASRMAEFALEQIHFIENLDFDLIEVSLKAFDVPTTIEANRIIAEQMPYPLHLGITEAGLPKAGSIRSAVGLGTLLYQGIGDSLRISLTTLDPPEEIFTAYEILRALSLRQRGPTLVSCPICGRAEIDLVPIANEIQQRLRGIEKPLKLALCACVVNGPGEAREADIGLAGGKKKGAIFKRGKVVKVVEEDKLADALVSEIEQM